MRWGFAMKRHCFFTLFDEQLGGFFESLVKAACTEEYIWYRGIIFNISDACTSIRFVLRDVFIVFHSFRPMFSSVTRAIMWCIVCGFSKLSYGGRCPKMLQISASRTQHQQQKASPLRIEVGGHQTRCRLGRAAVPPFAVACPGGNCLWDACGSGVS